MLNPTTFSTINNNFSSGQGLARQIPIMPHMQGSATFTCDSTTSLRPPVQAYAAQSCLKISSSLLTSACRL
jgi:hypothetical protein